MARRRLRSQRKTLRLIGVGVGALLLLLLVIGAVVLSWQPYVRVSEIGVRGTETINPTQVTANVAASLDGRTLLFPNDSIALYSSARIEKNLQEAFPALKEAETQRTRLTSIAVNVIEREPAFHWCGESTATTSPCFVGDTQGFLFRRDEVASSTLPTLYGPLTQKTDVLRSYVRAPGSAESVVALARTLTDAGIQVAHAALQVNDEVTLMLASGPQVYYVLGRESHVAETLPTLLEEVTKPEEPVEYIDMRFGDRIYVKRRE